MCIGGKKGGLLGKIADPAGYIGRKVGGTAGMFIDPAGAITDPDSFQKKAPAAIRAATAPKKRKPKTVLSGDDEETNVLG
tara:strand:- start:713 stop:952 length:240 start_codon:yes stop_codon:yes gene_type:complete